MWGLLWSLSCLYFQCFPLHKSSIHSKIQVILCSNWRNIVNQLYFNKKKKINLFIGEITIKKNYLFRAAPMACGSSVSLLWAFNFWKAHRRDTASEGIPGAGMGEVPESWYPRKKAEGPLECSSVSEALAVSLLAVLSWGKKVILEFSTLFISIK